MAGLTSQERVDSSTPERMTPLQTAALALQKARAKIDALVAAKNEAIAIVGMSCRVPGDAHSPAAFWELLRHGRCAVDHVPADRWDADALWAPDSDAPGKVSCKTGAFLRDIDRFDAAFFGISPREAVSLDPQQRLLLELTVEALENSGIPCDSLENSKTGVFVAISARDYLDVQDDAPERIDPYIGTGNLLSVAAGRISYVFGLQGPCVPVDTTCSSSLVALHLASQSLRAGECELAVVAGVNAMLSPKNFIFFSRLRALAPDGLCKTFDAAANGYGRGEGAFVVILQRRADALSARAPIRALILGSAVNHDGRSNGLTAPNGPAQERVLRDALAQAGVAPDEVAYVEAHGTGTPLGDPIEVGALGRVFQGRPAQRPLLLGSVKTNLGHLEAAAGMAALFKVVLSLEAAKLPPHLHFQTPNPQIPWSKLPVRVVRELSDWPTGRRIAGVSSFGLSGTNAHVVLCEAPALADPGVMPAREFALLTVSARSDAALGELSERYAALVERSSERLHEIAAASALQRSHHVRRLAVVAGSAADAASKLRQRARELPAGSAQPLLVAFVIPGHGSQWRGMGRALMESEPAFREQMQACDAVMRERHGFQLLHVLADDELSAVDVVQPALFAISVSLGVMLRHFGVKADAVVGQSMGEIAAAFLVGSLSLEDAVAVVCTRSRLLKRFTGGHGMAAIELSQEEAERAIASLSPRLAVAVSQSPRSTVVGGDLAALEQLIAALTRQGISARQVKVDYASHTPQMDALVPELVQELSALRPRPAHTAMYSSTTLDVLDGPELDAQYWARNLREPVRFAQAIAKLREAGYSAFVELSPHPVNLFAIEDTLRSAGAEGLCLPAMRRDRPAQETYLELIAALYERGLTPAFNALFTGPRPSVALPNYAWQRERFWAEPKPQRSGAAEQAAMPHALRLRVAGDWVQELHLDLSTSGYLADHRVADTVLYPAAGYLNLAWAAASRMLETSDFTLREIAFEEVMPLQPEAPRVVQMVLTRELSGALTFTIASRLRGEPESQAQVHARGVAVLGEREQPLPLTAAQPTAPITLTGAQLYERLAANGLHYGPAFQAIESLWCESDGVGCARICLPDGVDGAAAIHPVLLDAAFQTMAMAVADSDDPRVFVPARLQSMWLRGPVPRRAWARAKLVTREADAFCCDVSIENDEGVAIFEGRGLRAVAFGAATRSDHARVAIAPWLFQLCWRASEHKATQLPAACGGVLLVAEAGTLRERVKDSLERRGHRVVEAEPATSVGGYEPALRASCSSELVVHLCTASQPLANGTGARTTIEQLTGRECSTLLALVQALTRASLDVAPRLALVTLGAQHAVEDEPINLAQAALSGFARTIVHEHPELALRHIDLSPQPSDAEIVQLMAELSSADEEDQIALRGERRLCARLERVDAHEPRRARSRARGRPYRLARSRAQGLQGVFLERFEPTAPGPGEVEIAVQHAGINFLDVLLLMGAIPEESLADDTAPLGGECAGVVTRVGEGVVAVRPGDAVVAIATGAFATHARADARLVFPQPEGFTSAEAATTPIAFITAYYALSHVARLRPGERVLIHAGAGGVGRAAIQCARLLGAEIYVSAGSQAKREELLALGVRCAVDSRSVDFDREIRAATGGEGVDVVLNSLAGPFLAKSLELLRHGGRFVEIGKRDYLADHKLGLRPLLRNLSLSLVDLRALCQHEPERVAAVYAEIAQQFSAGTLRPLPVRELPMDEAAAAFQCMSQGQHSGKLALRVEVDEPLIAADPRAYAHGTVVITGGLGGLGLTLAQALVKGGNRSLALLSRRSSADAERAVSALRAAGADVMVELVDVADAAALRRSLERIRAALAPICGVVHAAGVLDDGMLHALDSRRFLDVLRPKISGACNLELATADLPLDFFVSCSSGAALLGSPGQASYAAANAFLGAFAHARKARREPAQSIAWGAISDVGMVAVDRKRRERVEYRGMESLTPDEAVRSLFTLLDWADPLVGVLKLDLRQWTHFYPRAAHAPLLAELRRDDGGAAQRAGKSVLRSRLDAAESHASRCEILLLYLVEKLASVLRLPIEKIDRDAKLKALGMDSLMALELRNRVESDLGLRLSVTAIWNYPSIGQLVEHLASRLDPTLPTPAMARSEETIVKAVKAAAPAPELDLLDASALLSEFDASLERLQKLAELEHE